MVFLSVGGGGITTDAPPHLTPPPLTPPPRLPPHFFWQWFRLNPKKQRSTSAAPPLCPPLKNVPPPTLPPHLKTPWGVSDPRSYQFRPFTQRRDHPPSSKQKSFVQEGSAIIRERQVHFLGTTQAVFLSWGTWTINLFSNAPFFASPLHGLVHASFFLRKALGSLAKKKHNRL